MKKSLIYSSAVIVIFIAGFLAGSFYMTLRLTKSQFMAESGAGEDYADTLYPSDDSFWEVKYFGGMWVGEKTLKPLPKGKGYLTGEFLHGGKPVHGLEFTMTLNSKYKTGRIVTDDNGMFEVRLPLGTWRINSIHCRKWKDKPDGRFILISGDEKLEDGMYFGLSGTGKKVLVQKSKPDKKHVTITINPRIKVNWPDGNIPKQDASVDESTISWQPYPGAEEYLVTIYRVTRKGPDKHFSPILYKRVSANVLPLSALGHASSTGSREEYSLHIRALDADNTLLSESEHVVGTFTLTDGHVLLEGGDMETDLMDERSIESLFQNAKRANAIETLIEAHMLKEAGILLSKLEDKNMEGRKELLSGYLYASQGNCIKAEQYFESAQNKGVACVPDEYRVDCE